MKLGSLLAAKERQRGYVRIPICREVGLVGIPLAALKAAMELFPDDTQLHRWFADPCTAVVQAVLSSYSFPPVSEGARIPQLDIEFSEIIEPDGSKGYTARFASVGDCVISPTNGLEKAIAAAVVAQYTK